MVDLEPDSRDAREFRFWSLAYRLGVVRNKRAEENRDPRNFAGQRGAGSGDGGRSCAGQLIVFRLWRQAFTTRGTHGTTGGHRKRDGGDRMRRTDPEVRAQIYNYGFWRRN